MVENGVPHGDGLRRTHAGRWKTLRLVPFPDRSGWKTGEMSKNPHTIASGGGGVTIATVASLDRFQTQPIWEIPVCSCRTLDSRGMMKRAIPHFPFDFPHFGTRFAPDLLKTGFRTINMPR